MHFLIMIAALTYSQWGFDRYQGPLKPMAPFETDYNDEFPKSA